jgi:hypothetical protein
MAVGSSRFGGGAIDIAVVVRDFIDHEVHDDADDDDDDDGDGVRGRFR